MFGTDVNDELVDKYRPRMAKVFKLLTGLGVDAKAHGFDLSPCLQRLTELSLPSSTGAKDIGTKPAGVH